MPKYSENYAIAMSRIADLERKILKRDDPMAVSMIEFLVSRDLLTDWANYHIESNK